VRRRKALALSGEHQATLVSFSPEQVLETWYEKSLIPFVYLRLAQKFSFDQVNDPASTAAAANGQFLMIQRAVYDAVGGHAEIHSEVLEDVALARRVKSAGNRIWFFVWRGHRASAHVPFVFSHVGRWKKNLFQLMGGSSGSVFAEFESAFPWMIFVVLLIGIKVPIAVFAGVMRCCCASFLTGWRSPVTIFHSNSSFITCRQYSCTRARSGLRTKAMPKGKSPGRAGSTPSARPEHLSRDIAMVYLTRKLEFSASHRYHNPALSRRRTSASSVNAIIRTAMGTTTRWR